VHPLENVYVKI